MSTEKRDDYYFDLSARLLGDKGRKKTILDKNHIERDDNVVITAILLEICDYLKR